MEFVFPEIKAMGVGKICILVHFIFLNQQVPSSALYCCCDNFAFNRP